MYCQVEDVEPVFAGQFVPFARQTDEPPREIDPPVIATLADVRVPMVAVLELMLVPEALVYARAVVVAPVKVAFVITPLVAKRAVVVTFVANMFTDVALVDETAVAKRVPRTPTWSWKKASFPFKENCEARTPV